MPLRRMILIALVLYVTADYCDPSLPGVFSFASKSLYVDSIRPSSPVVSVSVLATFLQPLQVFAVTVPPCVVIAVGVVQHRLSCLPVRPRSMIAASLQDSPRSSEDN